jgi:hypothetical protein
VRKALSLRALLSTNLADVLSASQGELLILKYFLFNSGNLTRSLAASGLFSSARCEELQRLFSPKQRDKNQVILHHLAKKCWEILRQNTLLRTHNSDWQEYVL